MITPADLRSTFLFAALDDEQIAALLENGEEVSFDVDDILFEEGEPADFLWVLIEGRVRLFRRTENEETLLLAMDQPGQWSGGFRAWHSDAGYLATSRGASRGRMFKLPATSLNRLAHAWFPLGVHLIEGVFHTVRRLEARTREHDALVALGRISAGLAHELNNPAAAAARAVEALDYNCLHMFESLEELATQEQRAAEFIALDGLRRALSEVMPTRPDPLALADREERLADWFDDHGVEAAWRIAPTLAAAGAEVDWCERVAAALRPETLEPGFEWVASAVAVSTLVQEIREANARISGLVDSVRSYSQVDRAPRQTFDVIEGIESTLTILRHRIGDGVTVARAYGDELPLIDGYPRELNQVWTNLITNAVDAMDGHGTLEIAVHSDREHVIVEIEDSGGGMPADVQARAFEPFFTTKDVGAGTGLGLDISRRIVEERHKGIISIESQPGRTVLRVRLPIAPD